MGNPMKLTALLQKENQPARRKWERGSRRRLLLRRVVWKWGLRPLQV
uniref:Uncharacterized protein n=1 Tax=Anguilla anguilla TaxID=7936 RepID=A0A0E9PKH4_ANGAN